MFRHLSGTSQVISVAAGPLNAQLQSNIGNAVLLTNLGTNQCYVEFGATSATTRATVAGLPIEGGQRLLVARDALRDLFVSAICDSGESTTLKITVGFADSAST